MSTNPIYVIQTSLEKLQSLDPDLRFMGFSDLNTMLSDKSIESTLKDESHLTVNVCRGILGKLDDPITEVQNQAVKCLEPLVQLVGDREVELIVNALDDKLKADKDDNSSIYSMALRSVILSARATSSIAHILAKSLLARLQDVGPEQWTTEDMEILTDLIKRYGSSFSPTEVGTAQNLLINLFQYGRGLIRRRAVSTVGVLSRYLPTAKFDALITYLINGLTVSKDNETLRTILQLNSVLSKSDAVRFSSAVHSVFPGIYKALALEALDHEGNLDDDDEDLGENQDDDDQNSNLLEVREAALTALESITSFQSTETEAYLSEILDACRVFLKYDPNYISNGDDEVDAAQDDMDADEDDDFYGSDIEEGDAEFSDDEDQSWKLRRSAAKLAISIVQSHQKNLPVIFDTLLKPIIARFAAEREESVKVEWVSTLSAFIGRASYDAPYYASKEIAHKQKNSHGRRGSDSSMLLESDPQARLAEQSSRIIKLAFRGIEKSSTSVSEYRGLLISLVKTLVKALDDLDEEIPFIVEHLVALTESKSAFMIDILQLTSAILSEQQSLSTPILRNISSIIVTGIRDPYYKISSEALSAWLVFLDKYASTTSSFSVDDLQPSITEKAVSNATDVETREKAIKAIGTIASVPGLPQTAVDSACETVRDLLGNEALRLIDLDAVKQIVRSPSELRNQWISAIGHDLGTLLSQGQRSVRLATLSTLSQLAVRMADLGDDAEIVKTARYICSVITNTEVAGISDLQLVDLTVRITSKLWPLVQNSDTSTAVVSYALSILSVDLSFGIAGMTGSTGPIPDSNAESIQQTLFKDIISFLTVLISYYEPKQIEELYGAISTSGNRTEIGAQALATLIVQGGLTAAIDLFEAAISDRETYSVEEIQWALTVYGHYGQTSPVVQEQTVKSLYDCLKDANDRVRLAGAQALGRVISHHMRYLDALFPALLDKSASHYLPLAALRQTIQSASHGSAEDKQNIEARARDIWTTLFDIEIHESALDNDIQASQSIEGTKPVSGDAGDEQALVAECLGALSLLHPSSFLSALQEYWKSPNSKNRSTALEALKYSFDAVSNDDGTDVAFEDILRPAIGDVLLLLDDGDVAIRQRALGVIVSAIHKQPDTLSPYLNKFLPYLNKETVADPSLVRTVQMGPFRHKVDGGLEVRKAAYEAIYTIVNTFTADSLQDPTWLSEIIDRVIAGLSDEHEIKVLTLFIIGRLAQIDLDLLTTDKRLELVIAKFSTMIAVTVKENAIKQEFEKQGEVVRNVTRSSGQIDNAISAAKTGGSLNLSDIELQSWDEFYNSLVLKVGTSA